MTPREIGLVQASFERLLPLRDEVAMLFYGRLFELDPDTRPMFRGDIRHQGAKLMATLAVVVRSLHDLGPLLPTIDQLARRHRGYGVVDRHYYSVGAALIWTLEVGLGAGFTPELRAAWLQAFGTLSTRMMTAARETEEEPLAIAAE